MKIMFTSFLLAATIALAAGASSRDIAGGRGGRLLRGPSSVPELGGSADGVGALTDGIHSPERKLMTKNMIVTVDDVINVSDGEGPESEFKLTLSCKRFGGVVGSLFPQFSWDTETFLEWADDETFGIGGNNDPVTLFANVEGPVCHEQDKWMVTLVETDHCTGDDSVFSMGGIGFTPVSGSFDSGPAAGRYQVEFV